MSRRENVKPAERARWNNESREKHAADLARWREMEMVSVQVIDSGSGEDCPACTELVERGPIPIAEAPQVPPPDCACTPWCRCVLIAVE